MKLLYYVSMERQSKAMSEQTEESLDGGMKEKTGVS